MDDDMRAWLTWSVPIGIGILLAREALGPLAWFFAVLLAPALLLSDRVKQRLPTQVKVMIEMHVTSYLAMIVFLILLFGLLGLSSLFM